MGQPVSSGLHHWGVTQLWTHQSPMQYADKSFASYSLRLGAYSKITSLLLTGLVLIPKSNPWFSALKFFGISFAFGRKARTVAVFPSNQSAFSYYRNVSASLLGEDGGTPIYSLGYSARSMPGRLRYWGQVRSLIISNTTVFLLRGCNPRPAADRIAGSSLDIKLLSALSLNKTLRAASLAQQLF